MQDLTALYIGGDWRAPVSAARMEVENPATEAPFARIALAGQADVDAAVALQDVGVSSLPVNVLNPVEGTPIGRP